MERPANPGRACRVGPSAVGVALTLLAPVALSAQGAGPRVEIHAYGGRSWTQPSDLVLSSGPRRIELRDVAWREEPFQQPLYWGARLLLWLPGGAWGALVDFTHAKLTATASQPVRTVVRGEGAPLDLVQPLGETIERFRMTHGYNIVTLGGLGRFGNGRRVSPYVGLGGGVVIPHVEALIQGAATSRYQWGGFAARATAGLGIGVVGRLRLFCDYGVVLARSELVVEPTSTLEVPALTHTLNLGLAVRLLGAD
ncbi:MAG: hypothetical protein R3E10_11930 [Gemmatimonadota bacterium]